VTPPPAAPIATPVPATPAPAPVAATGSTKLQLGAYSGRAQAEKGWSDLQAKHGALLASLSPLIEEAQSNGKTVFRLRLGPMGDADAKKLCVDLKARGTACFIARN
jgi:cell division protein FtsN